MAGATRLLGATSIAGLSLSLWLYLDNRSLRSELAGKSSPPTATATATATSTAARTAAPAPPRSLLPGLRTAPPPEPALPAAPSDGRMERRARRTDDFAQMFGRLEGESEDDYKARMMPMISAGLLMPRLHAEENRKTAEDKAHVTPEQSAKLDKAFDKVYSDVIDYTNKLVADGQLSPYERNVAGWLEYAGGLGGILNDANGQIAKVLEPSQVKAMSDAGFEWGEYLGIKAPWEQLKAPPPRAH